MRKIFRRKGEEVMRGTEKLPIEKFHLKKYYPGDPTRNEEVAGHTMKKSTA